MKHVIVQKWLYDRLAKFLTDNVTFVGDARDSDAPFRVSATLRRTGKPPVLELLEGHVWCDRHGLVHEDDLNPYDYVDESDKCQPEQHRPVYAAAAGGSHGKGRDK